MDSLVIRRMSSSSASVRQRLPQTRHQLSTRLMLPTSRDIGAQETSSSEEDSTMKAKLSSSTTWSNTITSLRLGRNRSQERRPTWSIKTSDTSAPLTISAEIPLKVCKRRVSATLERLTVPDKLVGIDNGGLLMPSRERL